MSVYLKKITTAEIYTKILVDFLVPFICDVFTPCATNLYKITTPSTLPAMLGGFFPEFYQLVANPS